MRILFATAEAYPLAKVGGLGDVAGSLPKALKALGHDVRIVLPRYGSIRDTGRDLGTFPVRIGNESVEARLRMSNIDAVPVYLIDYPPLFDREKIYEYEDDGKRFGFFCKAVLDMLPASDFWPEVIHANDWHTALVPTFLTTARAHDGRYGRIGTILTIHNLQHQGLFGRDLFEWLGLPAESWGVEGVEFYGRLNFLKAGIVHADRVTTVSPTYAREIQTEEFGVRLDGLLRSRSAKLSGILNGIDTDVWNPARDSFIIQKYSKSTVERKAANKAALQREAALPPVATVPLLGMVSRVTDQKGFDILMPALGDILDIGAQVVLLGAGEAKYEATLSELAKSTPGFVAFLKYDETMAHRIYAGSDFFLMPSKFEPCGLGQMISLRYGTLPIVRRTGGLADTVIDLSSEAKMGNGFVFSDYTPEAFVDAVRRAVDFYRGPRGLKTARQRAMSADLSWKASARKYAALYQQAASEAGR